MTGEWRQVGKLVYDLSSEIGEALDSEEADNFARSHNAALRAAVEVERDGCLMDVLVELENRGFYSMASRVRAVIHARMEKPSSG